MPDETYAIAKDCRHIGYKDQYGIGRLMALPAEASRHVHKDELCAILGRYRSIAIIGIGIDLGPKIRMGDQGPCPYCWPQQQTLVPLEPRPLEANPKIKEWIDAFAKEGVSLDPIIAGGFANTNFWNRADGGKQWFDWAMQAELAKGKEAKDAV